MTVMYPLHEKIPPEEAFRVGYRTQLGGGQHWPGGLTLEEAEKRLAERQAEIAGRNAPSPTSWYIERVTFYRLTELVSEVRA
ncbi:hypothetical protein [Kribbella sp. NPDC051718]|uniref:hypothetical protein n=1 Tax=Kribbella sp. NPDC051718 TaxID=3155168 RepID=UPI0034137469